MSDNKFSFCRHLKSTLFHTIFHSHISYPFTFSFSSHFIIITIIISQRQCICVMVLRLLPNSWSHMNWTERIIYWKLHVAVLAHQRLRHEIGPVWDDGSLAFSTILHGFLHCQVNLLNTSVVNYDQLEPFGGARVRFWEDEVSEVSKALEQQLGLAATEKLLQKYLQTARYYV